MRSLLFSLMAVVVAHGAALADGERGGARKAALPAPQPSVAVTVERGVRVWRPLGTDGGIETGPILPVRVSGGASGGVSVPFYAAPLVGAGGGFGGYGSRHGGYGKAGKRWHGVGFNTGHRGAGAWGHIGPKRFAHAGPGHRKPGGHGHGHR